jgi:hypothetical protein
MTDHFTKAEKAEIAENKAEAKAEAAELKVEAKMAASQKAYVEGRMAAAKKEDEANKKAKGE